MDRRGGTVMPPTRIGFCQNGVGIPPPAVPGGALPKSMGTAAFCWKCALARRTRGVGIKAQINGTRSAFSTVGSARVGLRRFVLLEGKSAFEVLEGIRHP